MSKRLMILVLSLLALTGCGEDDMADLNQYLEEVKARPKVPIEPLPIIRPVESFVFNPEGLRDPFQPLENALNGKNVDLSAVNGVKPDLQRKKDELEAYALDTLRMVGTLTNQKGLWALIRAQDGSIHRIQAGQHMGLNYGRVIKILPNKIELMEIVPDRPGTWREQAASLALAE
jgi:type IV pilus assembly protein PilP